MAHGDVVAQGQREAAGVEGGVVGDVQHGVILHTGTGADNDPVHVAAHHGAGPHGAVVAEGHLPDHGGGRVDENPFTLAWHLVLEASNPHLTPVHQDESDPL